MKIKFFSKFRKNKENIETKPVIISPNNNTMPIYPLNISNNMNSALSYTTVRETKPEQSKEIDLGAVIATSNVKFMDETFNPYKFSLFRELDRYDEPSFYRNYENSYKQNPFTKMVIEFLMNEIFSNDYHFEGEGSEEVEKFFFEDNTRNKIEMAWRETLIKGNGFLDITIKNSKAIKTRVLNTDTIYIELDNNTGERIYTQMGKKLRSENLIHFIINEKENSPYGISILRPNLVFLTALYDVGGDAVAALKRIAYAPIVAQLDLERIPDNERDEYVKNFAEKLSELQSATNNFAIDKKHNITLLGQGSTGARLLPINQIIEPILSVILINFGIPLGIFLQTGANKAIIDEQRKAMQKYYENMRTKIKYYVEKKLIPLITNKNCKLIFNKPPLISNSEARESMLLYLKMYESGLVSKEWVIDQWDILDNGKTFNTKHKGVVYDDRQ